jgi:hypothetical protein
MQKMKMIAAAVVLMAGCGGAAAQSYGRGDPAWAYTGDPTQRWSRGYDAYAAAPGWRQGWQQRGMNRGYDAYAAAPDGRRGWQQRGMNRGMYQAQSGGNGSPVSAGSWRGSTDRSSPNSPFASGPYGDGMQRY